MKKLLPSRIAGLTFLYGIVFCILVIVQFSNKRDFSLPVGDMTVRGRYLQPSEEIVESSMYPLTGGVKVFFGGLELNLTEARSKGLYITDIDGSIIPVNPDFMLIENNSVRFGLHGGTMVVLTSTNTEWRSELQISAEFINNITQINIPIRLRRSSLIHENERMGILYEGANYFLDTQGNELEEGWLAFTRDSAVMSYHTRGRLRAFDPADYIIPQANNYEASVASWRNISFSHWRQNASAIQEEEDKIAFVTEALNQGNYAMAVTSVSTNFINTSQQTYRSSGFLGGMSSAYNSFRYAEVEDLIRISDLTKEGSFDILKEEHVLNYLFTRGNNALAYNIIDLIHSMNMEKITLEYCAGLLEMYMDMRQWRPSLNCPVKPMIEEILLLVSDKLEKDSKNNLVYVSVSDGADSIEYSLRLGIAILAWTETASSYSPLENTNYRATWEGIGRSLVVSALTSGGTGAGKLYNILKPTEYYARAAWLSDNGHWAWTVSPSVSLLNIDGNLNFSFLFPVNMSHYVMIRGVRPFIKIQIHGMDWRTDSQFEIYDSSGWVYYPQDQILVIKLRHRQTVENVVVYYVVEAPPPPARVVDVLAPGEEGAENTGEDAVDQ
jgi:hypothetical protein